MEAAGISGLAFAACLALAPLTLWVLRKARIVDVPNERSSHHSTTPRGGGFAPAVACTVAVAASSQLVGYERTGLLVVAVGMALIGLVDDLRSLHPLRRLVAQLVVGAIALTWLSHAITGSPAWRMLVAVGVMLWVVAYVNAFNFMDGINGIAVAQVLTAGITWWIIGLTQQAHAFAVAGLVIAGGAAAFAPFNFPRARMFLGDVGSYFFGGWLAATAVIGLGYHLPPEAVLGPLAIFSADTFFALVRRFRRGDGWYRPHREHVYQRLVQSGWSHPRTSLAVTAAMVACSGLGALSLTGSVAARAIGDAFGLAVVAIYLKAPELRHRHSAVDAARRSKG